MKAKKDLSELGICTKHITSVLQQAGWNIETQVREEVAFTEENICVNDNLTSRDKKKRATFILYDKPNIPVAMIEAKDNMHSVQAVYPTSYCVPQYCCEVGQTYEPLRPMRTTNHALANQRQAAYASSIAKSMNNAITRK